MVFDADYFIQKFSSIAEDKWITGNYVDSEGRRCAVGHCLIDEIEEEVHSLYVLFKCGHAAGVIPGRSVTYCNDGGQDWYDYASTPKRRILKALRALRDAEEKD